MIKFWKIAVTGILLISLFAIGGAVVHSGKENNNSNWLNEYIINQDDSVVHEYDLMNDKLEDGQLRYPIHDQSNNPIQDQSQGAGINLNDPNNQEYRAEYDAQTNQVTIYRRIGGMDVRLPYSMSLQEYQNADMRRSMAGYYRDKVQSDAGNSSPGLTGSGLGTAWKVGGDGFENVFGSNAISIKSQGSAEVLIGIKHTKIDNPALQEELRKTTTFDFDQKIQVNVQAAIGDKLKMGLNYNTEASFDFENQTKLEYSGKEDDIIKKIEFGNVTLPLPGTLITGSQSLFGAKAELQFGKLNVTTIFSQQKGQTKVLNIEGGAQEQKFEVGASEYDKNRHFFLALHFRDIYEDGLRDLPVINSPVVIQRIEVWVTNKSGNYDQSRNIVAFTDLAEDQLSSNGLWTVNTDTLPSNETNSLYDEMNSTYKDVRNFNRASEIFSGSDFTNADFAQVKDYEKIENARKLAPTEYTINDRLGFISLNTALNNDEILAVAYEYTYNGKLYKVGDLSTSGVEAPQTLYLKLLKGTNLSPDYKTTWNLMMKNIYSIGAFQVSNENFRMDVNLLSDTTGGLINYFPEGDENIRKKRLLKLMGLDNLNQQLEPSTQGDGVFDFVEGFTIYPSNGRIIFPVLEPFGKHLEKLINDTTISPKFVFQELYDKTLTDAGQQANKNKFYLTGKYKSAGGSDISLSAMDIPEGSVVVTAGGIVLKENVDYTVDYTLGRVKIINKGLLESGTPIQVSLESRALFNLQTKTLMGMHLDYRFNPKFNIGATIMNLREQPLTSKVAIGSEPINNTIWGMNTTYITESEALTNLLNKYPWWNLKETSNLSIDAEFAQLVPGHNKAVGREGTSYLDDFEGTTSSIDLRNWTAWTLASIPQKQPTLFPEGSLLNDLGSGYNRARLAWYVIDPLFYTKSGTRPAHINNNDISDDRVRQVQINEIYPNRNTAYGQPNNIAVFNLAYYPSERGQYNYDTNVDVKTGQLLNPQSRWAGIMRPIETNDFEAANIEYIEFWMMDPSFNDPTYTGGDLYLNLGNVSEDVLRDGRKTFEQGLPVPGEIAQIDSTNWGVVPNKQSLVNAFNNDPLSRFQQDIGLDGLNDDGEYNFYTSFIANLPAEVQKQMSADPSSDNFHYFRGSDYDAQQKSILDRYKYYNNNEGNSRPSEYSPESYATAATSIPDQEDINKDNTLSESESYFQYRVSLRKSDLEVGKNFIVDSRNSSNIVLPNGQKSTATWYQFRIPVNDVSRQAINNIKDLRSVRFMRLFLKDCMDTTILRFGAMDLVRGDWRQFTDNLSDDKAILDSTAFNLSSINIEENAQRTPINYVLPPGVDRVQNPSNPQVQLLNEQSLVMRVDKLGVGDARGAYKNLNMDIRQYKRLKMFIHAEARELNGVSDKEMAAFIRIGSDFTDNYYEYEIPLKITPWGDNNAASVWPIENEINLKLENLEAVKLERNDLKRAGAGASYSKRFVRSDPDFTDHNIVVMGNPSISNVRSVMIGVRNRRSTQNFESKSVEIWVNELRLTDFNEDGGWASNARTTIKLAEFGTVAIAGATSSIGFGSIDKSVSERSQNDFYQYDVATTLELGKLMGATSRMSVPFYWSNSQAISNPKYYPIDPDIQLSTALKNADTKKERDEIKSVSQDLTTRKSINFTNVKLMPKGDKVPVYDPSNLSATYSFNETYKQNTSTTFYSDQNYRGVLGYNYNARPKAIEPFSKSSTLNNQAFRLIKDFNFYPYPTQVAYSWEMTRNYREEQYRNLSDPNEIIPLVVKKDFYWNRFFDLKYNITKNLKFDFRAITNARIDEPEGQVNRFTDNYNQWKDSVLTNIRNFGRTTTYQHNFNFNYTIPINKLPYLDWTSASLRYGAMYGWAVKPLTTSGIEMGNTIRNSNTIQSTGQLNFSSLYNKSNYIKGIWKKYDFDPAAKPKDKKQSTENVRFNKNGLTFTKGSPITIEHKLKTTDVTLRAFDKNGKPINGATKVTGPNQIEFTPETSTEGGRIMVTGVIKNETSVIQTVADISVLLLTSVKNLSINYSENNGTILPGYMPNSGFLGMSNAAPGIPFIMGWQSRSFAQDAIDKGWLTNDYRFNSPYAMVNSKDFSIKTNIEPFRGVKIELLSDRRFTYNLNEYYSYNNTSGNYEGPKATRETGTFSMSFIAISTFKKINTSGAMDSKAYNDFLATRPMISHRLAGTTPQPSDTTQYADGYGALSQDVLIPSFLSAYSGISPNSIFLKAIPSFSAMMPNWRISYDGIGRIKPVRRVAKTVDLTHAYRCTYNVGGYSTNLLEDGQTRDYANNYISKYQIGTVSITEQFSPLIAVNITWENNLTTRFEMKKGRTLNLSMTNNQLIENYNDENVIGLGYRFDKLGLILNNKKITNDINLRIDYSIRENQSVIRKIQENVNQLTAGMRITAFIFTADYAINSRYNIQAYFKRNVNTPFISLSYPTTDANYGISFRMSLAQ